VLEQFWSRRMKMVLITALATSQKSSMSIKRSIFNYWKRNVGSHTGFNLNHFHVYLNPTVMPMIVYTDHNPNMLINKMKDKNQRLLRWSLNLQQYNVDIRHIKGKENIFADALSRVWLWTLTILCSLTVFECCKCRNVWWLSFYHVAF